MKHLSTSNILAYYEHSRINDVKHFIRLGPGSFKGAQECLYLLIHIA